MPNILTQQLDRLTPAERAELERLAANAGMTVAEWIEFSQKAQIYHNAQEILSGKYSSKVADDIRGFLASKKGAAQ